MPDEVVYIEHAQDVLGHAASLIKDGEAFTLVSSVEIKGGTARELGSLALVSASGQMVGYLSNGCIDQDIRLNALEALETGVRKVVHYGEGSPFPDLTLPCGGMLKVLLDPTPNIQALQDAHGRLNARHPAVLVHDAGSDLGSLAVEYTPKPRVTLAGRGAVLRATARMAQASGFEVFGLSPDLEDAQAFAHPEAFEHLVSPTSGADLALDHWSAFLTLFHDHSWEPALLAAALKTEARFIGALGSPKTHEARCQSLLAMGVRADQIERVKGPVGLVPSLRSADLIAASILAELAGVFARSHRIGAGSETQVA